MGAEADYKPFEKVVEKGRAILRLHGTEKQRAKVEAAKVHVIMDAIVQGWDIDIRYADIEGDLDISKIANKLGHAHGRLVVKGNIGMRRCNISGSADFRSAQFRGSANFGSAQFIGSANFKSAHFIEDANFVSAQFSGDADFVSAQFSGLADFRSQFSGSANFGSAQFSEYACFVSAQFSGLANFRSAQFSGSAYFGSVVMAEPANFADVTFRENHVFKGLWNTTVDRIKRLHWQATDFSDFNTEKVMDGASNPWLKRYINDELWIQSWRKRSWWRELLFTIWELTSHCGRSIGLWAFWSALIATVFAFVYRAFGPGSITFNVARLDSFQPDIWDYLYYSVVTFTTLGFGDIVPLTKPARLAVGAEVVLGYVMLGGLISIFANKLARRS